MVDFTSTLADKMSVISIFFVKLCDTTGFLITIILLSLLCKTTDKTIEGLIMKTALRGKDQTTRSVH